MSLRTAVTAFLQRRHGAKAEAAAARHDARRAVGREAAPTPRDVAVGGQTGSTVA